MIIFYNSFRSKFINIPIRNYQVYGKPLSGLRETTGSIRIMRNLDDDFLNATQLSVNH